MIDDKFDMIIKLVLIGESSVGKTNLLLRYTENKYDFSQKPTIGMDFVSKEVTIDNRIIKVQFWDTAGQEKYKSIANTYFKVSNGVVLVYDVTRRESFDKLEKWLRDVKNNAPVDAKILLVGNKIDLVDQRQITTEEGRRFAESNSLYFWETSCKTNENNCVFSAIDNIIAECKKEMVKHEEMEVLDRSDRVLNMIDVKNSKKGCCG